jgi:hypothetical protein
MYDWKQKQELIIATVFHARPALVLFFTAVCIDVISYARRALLLVVPAVCVVLRPMQDRHYCYSSLRSTSPFRLWQASVSSITCCRLHHLASCARPALLLFFPAVCSDVVVCTEPTLLLLFPAVCIVLRPMQDRHYCYSSLRSALTSSFMRGWHCCYSSLRSALTLHPARNRHCCYSSLLSTSPCVLCKTGITAILPRGLH